MEHKELTERIIGAAIEVHRALGPGYIESAYEEALCIELRCRLSSSNVKKAVCFYRGENVAEHRLDLLVESLIVVELKAISALENIHFAMVRSYLKASGLNCGLLINFAAVSLTVKRIGREFTAREVPDFRA